MSCARLRARVSMAESASASAAARRNGCQTTLGRSQTTRWVPGDDTALCTTASLQDGAAAVSFVPSTG